MILVTLPALLVLAISVVLEAELLPPVIGYQIQPQSGIIVMVDTTSNQKKKLRK